MSPEEITLPRGEVAQLFDLICASMDFGSGFLETDDVELLRRIAVAIGVDPMTGTPAEFRTQYPHAFKQWAPRRYTAPESARPWFPVTPPRHRPPRLPDRCEVCDAPRAHPVHGKGAPR